MPLATIAAVVSIASGVAGIASTLGAFGGSPKAPEPVMPNNNPAEPETAKRTAEDKTRRRALAAATQNSTILTSPTGIESSGRTILGG